MKVCKRCILDERIPGIVFDSDGVCNFCKKHDEMEKQYVISDTVLSRKVRDIKDKNKNSRYDAIAGVSGGADSSYLISKMHDYGLRMLGVHFDNGWNTDIAERNIKRLEECFDIDMLRFRMDRKEFNDLNKAFLYASTPDADIPNDMALVACLYMACEAFDVKTILDGHSFRTEGFMPVDWSYMDGGYVLSVHNQFGTVPAKTFPNLEFYKQLKWLRMGIERFRGLYHIDYVKEDAMREMNSDFGWEWYGSHHGENVYTKFVGAYLRPKKFGIDPRIVELSAFVRSGQMSRDTALELFQEELSLEKEYLERVQNELHISDNELDVIMNLDVKSHNDYDTYHPLFRKNYDVFKRMYEKGLIAKTFFMKYVEK